MLAWAKQTSWCWPLGRQPGLRAGPWLGQVGRATVLPLVPMLSWASHGVPATPSSHTSGDDWWAWVSMAHQGQRQPESMCSPWVATYYRYCPSPIPLNRQGHPALRCEGCTAACFSGAAFGGWEPPPPVTLPPAGGGAEAKDNACGGDSPAPLLLGRTPLGCLSHSELSHQAALDSLEATTCSLPRFLGSCLPHRFLLRALPTHPCP